jgi:hypothetical protein
MREDATDLKELEWALASLTPRCGLDRSEVLFRAGRASAPRGWGWPVAACSSLLAAVLGILLLSRPAPTPGVVYIHAPVMVPPASPPLPPPPAPPAREEPSATPSVDATTWHSVPEGIHLREHLLHWGLDGLTPPSRAPAEPGVKRGELMHGGD